MGSVTVTGIDPQQLERMLRIALGLPGRVVSLERAPEPEKAAPVLHIDGVRAADIIDKYAAKRSSHR